MWPLELCHKNIDSSFFPCLSVTFHGNRWKMCESSLSNSRSINLFAKQHQPFGWNLKKKRTFFYKTNETFKSLQKLDWLYLSLSKLCSFGRFLVTTAYWLKFEMHWSCVKFESWLCDMVFFIYLTSNSVSVALCL